MAKDTLEDQVKNRQKHMVDALEKRVPIEENKEIKDIMEEQKAVDKVMVAYTDAIKQIEREIKQIIKNKCDTKTNKAGDKPDEEAKDTVNKAKRKKCRYFDKGFCKYNNKCRFLHPDNICK
jgi:hypothetical protein